MASQSMHMHPVHKFEFFCPILTFLMPCHHRNCRNTDAYVLHALNLLRVGMLILVIVTTLREGLERLNLQEMVAGEVGTPDQIAALVSYLVSKEAQYVTGKDQYRSYHNFSDTSSLRTKRLIFFHMSGDPL
jgi:hypothetical protein